MSRKDDLEKQILESYGIIAEYEGTILNSDRPEEGNRAQRNIQKQWALIRNYAGEYLSLCERLSLDFRREVVEIIAHFSEYDHAVSSSTAGSLRGLGRAGASDRGTVEPAPVKGSADQGRSARRAFDVFLCYNSTDRVHVRRVAEQLKERGLSVWFDEWVASPGQPWQRLLEQHIAGVSSAAIFIGSSGVGPWQRQEMDAFLREFVDRGCPVIPVVLPGVEADVEVPIFLKAMTWVHLGTAYPDPVERLIWGITGRRDGQD